MSGGWHLYNLNRYDKTATVTYQEYDNRIYKSDYTGSVIIPEKIIFEDVEYSVTHIGDYAFFNCKYITSVTIGNSVISIGLEAFRSCTNLTSIAIPNSVTTIGKNAFAYCYALTSVDIPNSVISIGDSAFRPCNGLASITIPNSVTSIGFSAFYACSGQTSIIVESGNPKYDSRNNCNAIIETSTNVLMTGCMNTVIPQTVTTIEAFAFAHCSGLTAITIPNSVTTINQYAFEYCRGLTSLTIPNSVTTIKFEVFSGCSGLTSIIVESGNPKYDSRNNCNAIIETSTNVLMTGCMNTVIPHTITRIGTNAFDGCSSLTSISIPNSVTTLTKKFIHSN